MRKSLANLAAAGLLAAIGGTAQQAPAVETTAHQATRKPLRASEFNASAFNLQRLLQALGMARAGGGNLLGGYRSRAGWTNARYRRHALKLRNRARNRRACRG